MSKRSLGVVIARFQTPSLTAAHRYLLEQVATRSSRVLVLLGASPVTLTKRNPLEVSIRIRMVYDWWTEQYPSGPEAVVIPLHDRPTNEEWASQVDQAISAVNVGGDVRVFCGPDGAGPVYAAAGGRHPVEVLDHAGTHASRLRESLMPRHTEDFRAGVVYAVERRFLNPSPTVDAIIRDAGRFLLAHKREDGDRWRFVGGFVDVADGTLEHAVAREVREETGLEVSRPSYIGSARVDDWRFRDGPERVMTSLFAMDRVFGAARAADDIDAVEWFTDVDAVIHPIHRPLWDLYEDSLRRPQS